jgi:hypothetical protein
MNMSSFSFVYSIPKNLNVIITFGWRATLSNLNKINNTHCRFEDEQGDLFVIGVSSPHSSIAVFDSDLTEDEMTTEVDPSLSSWSFWPLNSMSQYIIEDQQ